MPAADRRAIRLSIRGCVQGVGFRPAVWRLASALHLRGWVCNDGLGVQLHLQGSTHHLRQFRQRLALALPQAARVESITECSAAWEDTDAFRIRIEDGGQAAMMARVPTDRAICARCQKDIVQEANRRRGHAFASCTDCGPRFSILQEMPYERSSTTMTDFAMCKECRAEYADARDRRFHAEPIACPSCGPRLSIDVCEAAEALRAGRILCLKGLGGYQLLVRADDEAAVLRLRQCKQRPSKPFAVMAESIDEADRIAWISAAERAELTSPENPIVLLKSRGVLPESVAPHLGQIGVLLPTTPLHLLLLQHLLLPVVATSGNRSDEPIAIDDDGRDGLISIADAVLDHNRSIVRRLDDSVVRVIDEQAMILRHARGYAPSSLPALERWAARHQPAIPPMLAVGGNQKAALALWSGAQAVLGQHLGDLDGPESRRAFHRARCDLSRVYQCEPSSLACDLHPDFFTTRWAQSAGVPFVQVQHHHAHAVACMVEHDLLEREVLGVIFDGTGFGPDGTIWGGEFLRASLTGFERVAALDSFVLPGGEAAIHEPYRIAVSLLTETFAAQEIRSCLIDWPGWPRQGTHTLLRMIERGIHAVPTSSVGRLFDGVASLVLGIDEVTYEGEAALWLESIVDLSEQAAYPMGVRVDAGGLTRGDWRPLVRGIVADLRAGVDRGVCAARFHNALARWVATTAAKFTGTEVVLGGGCFQNALLTSRTRDALASPGRRVYVPGRIPVNDGGLAVGQLAVGMARAGETRRSGC